MYLYSFSPHVYHCLIHSFINLNFSNIRHDSGGSAANSDEENEARSINKQNISITSQSKIIVIKDPIKIASAKFDLHNADAIEEEKANKGKSFRSNGNTKPRLSYAQLIAEALMGAEQRKLTLNDIYVKINARHPYYSLGGDRGNVMSPPNWQNAVRHNLTLNKVCNSTKFGTGRYSSYVFHLI